MYLGIDAALTPGVLADTMFFGVGLGQERKFATDTPHTIGVEFGTRVTEVLGRTLKLQIWDTGVAFWRCCNQQCRCALTLHCASRAGAVPGCDAQVSYQTLLL